jgi:calcineurin-like phosphoesterase family protein
LGFKRKDGTPLRDFPSIQEHDETLIQRWNSVVGVDDKVYHLGDVGFKNSTALAQILQRLNGTKVLIRGNHDNLKLSLYAQYFKDVRSGHVLDQILLAHIPIHPDSLGRWKGQVHGHTHANNLPDKRYMNVSVENINYTPIDFEEVREYFKND